MAENSSSDDDNNDDVVEDNDDDDESITNNMIDDIDGQEFPDGSELISTVLLPSSFW